MAIVTTPHSSQAAHGGYENTFSNAVNRWIYVFMAAFFILIVLTGFIPDSLAKLAAIDAGQRPPFPPILHVHAILMGSFVLILFAQATLAATGRLRYHRRLGVAGVVIAPALVIAGFILVPTMYHQIWNGLQTAPVEVQADIKKLLREFDDIMLEQIRIGICFALFILIAFLARNKDSGLHKRMMFLAIAIALPAAFDRMTWLPSTLPESPVSLDLNVLFALAPMFIWDLAHTRSVHKAYWIWLAFMVPSSVMIYGLWDTDWWHATAPRLVGVG